jgi:chromosome segregation ATPase
LVKTLPKITLLQQPIIERFPITELDPAGVALAAIQELNKKVAEIEQLKKDNTTLSARLDKLEEAIKMLTAQKEEANKKSLGELR